MRRATGGVVGAHSVCVPRRQLPRTLESARNHADFASSPRRDLDRTRRPLWIVAASAFVLAPACGSLPGDSEGVGTSGSAQSVEGPWRLPADVRTAGTQVNVTYDDVGRWTGESGCSGRLTEGARRVGAALRSRFPGITSIGGYSCRRNTANTSKMSVHGSGRALDIFIPKSGGSADNGQGDPVANFLVKNAERIGIQLIIWDRSVWRSNGRNESRYSGPHPHDDHLHVELTVESSRMQTPFFTSETTEDPGDAPTGTTETEGETPSEGEEDDPEVGSSSGSSGTGMPEPVDPKDPTKPTKPVEPVEPAPVEPPTPTTPTPTTPTEQTPEVDPPASATPTPQEIEPEGDDGPGARNSLGGSAPKSKKASSDEDEVSMASSGCAVSPAERGSATSPLAGFALGALVLRIARRRRRA